MFVVAAAAAATTTATAAAAVAAAASRGARSRSPRPRSPDFLDPALTYTVNGIEPLWIVYTPLLTYKHAEGAERHRADPGRGRGLPEMSKDGKTYKLTLRKGLKYSDGSPVKASDFEHTIKRVLNLESGGSASSTRSRAPRSTSKDGQAGRGHLGHHDRRQDRQDHDQADRAGRAFPYVLAMPSAGLVPGDTPFKNLTKDPPPGVGAYKVDGVGAQPAVRAREEHELQPSRASRRATSTRSR